MEKIFMPDLAAIRSAAKEASNGVWNDAWSNPDKTHESVLYAMTGEKENEDAVEIAFFRRKEDARWAAIVQPKTVLALLDMIEGKKN